MLSDIELPLPFWPDDVPAYLAGLDTLAPWVADASVLVPGHGHPTHQPMERLNADRRHLDDVLAGRTPDGPRMANAGMTEAYEHLVSLTGLD
jgi:glyoxylase-like metal-dependent hydrolase (beta-lactamase superfamily II)